MEELKDLEFRYYSKLVHKWWLDVSIAQENREQHHYSYLSKEDYDLMHEDLKKLREYSEDIFSILCEQVRNHRDWEVSNNVYLIATMGCGFSMENILKYCSMFSINTIYYCDTSSAALRELMYFWESKWNIVDVVNVNQQGKYNDIIISGFKLVNEKEK